MEYMLNRVNIFIFILFVSYNSQWSRESPKAINTSLEMIKYSIALVLWEKGLSQNLYSNDDIIDTLYNLTL
ncbi:hypothetical protein J5U21_01549 [Saccharolobus shibatae]|uniref:Uncharacterized protein n=1 Tax=Saccharolobus shibatae TaxID=2286 RepID=A0A8F5BV46_9CREN|nr:hypothetical protein J5U21_01549 [Saccharolobus shibatae]